MELIHPHTKADVVDALAEANRQGMRLLVVGGRIHMDKGNPADVDGELWTTMLDDLIAHEPAEMIAVVGAGMRAGDLTRRLAAEGQEWPWASDAPDEATVGGILGAAATSPRRLGVGAVRDSVLEIEVVTGDGRLVRCGARTVKNVTGYDVGRLLVGSLGTLGVIVQVALRLRPAPRGSVTVAAPVGGAAESFAIGRTLLEALPRATSLLITPTSIRVRLEGWEEEVEEMTASARDVFPALEPTEGDAPIEGPPWPDAPLLAEVSLPPSGLERLATIGGERWEALLGVGLAWVALDDLGSLDTLRERVADLGGIAPVVRGPGGLGEGALPALEVQRNLKRLFDPYGVLAPGRFWGGI